MLLYIEFQLLKVIYLHSHKYHCIAEWDEPAPEIGLNGGPKFNTLLFTLEDGSQVYMNRSTQKIYVWAPGSDFENIYVRDDFTYYLAAQAVVFSKIGDVDSTMGCVGFGYNPSPEYGFGTKLLRYPPSTEVNMKIFEISQIAKTFDIMAYSSQEILRDLPRFQTLAERLGKRTYQHREPRF